MSFEHYTKELVDKYQIGTSIIYVIGEHFCTVVTVKSNITTVQTLASKDVLVYINDLKDKNL